MDHLAPTGEGYRVEADPDSVRFILPCQPARAGGLVAIIFGMFFAGFALLWMLGVLGVLDPVFDSVFEMPEIGAPFEDPIDDEDPEDSEQLETPAPVPQPIETPATANEQLETPAKPVEKAKPKLPPYLEEMQKNFRESDADRGIDIGSIFMALFGIPFLLVGLGIILTGLLFLVGHEEIVLTDQTITSTYKAGPLRRSQKRMAGNMTHIEIGRNSPTDSQTGRRTRSNHVFHAIHAHFEGEAVLHLAAGQPMAMLRSLSKEIMQEWSRITDHKAIAITEPHHEEDAQSTLPYVPEYVPEQPASSRAVLDRLASGISLRVPPLGFTKATMPLMMFSLFWCGFVGLFTLIMFLSDVPLAMYLFISIFWAVGILIFLLGLNMMRKQAVIDVVHDTLLLTQQSIFGRKMHEWRRDELLDIRADHSGTSVNDRPLLNLQFIPREGKVVGLLTGRDDDELQWMAAQLRAAMQIRKQE